MKHALAALVTATMLSGCALATAGVKKGDERNFVRSLQDVNAGRAIEARMRRAYDYELGGIDVEVAEGVVLLSGNVPSQEDKIEAARIAWSAPQVQQVGNEVMLRDKQGLIRNTKDGFLEKSVRARLLADKYVKGRNYNVETHDGVVYIMGVARTKAELERAARIASLTRGTKEVISYARVADIRESTDMRQEDTRQAELRESWGGELAGGPSSAAPTPSRRALPDFVTDAPLPSQDSTTIPAPMRSAPLDEPIQLIQPSPVVPYGLGENNIVPADPGKAPYYVDPDTGEQIPVRW